MNKPPRYFYDPMEQLKRCGLAAGVSAAAVVLYTVGIVFGILHP